MLRPRRPAGPGDDLALTRLVIASRLDRRDLEVLEVAVNSSGSTDIIISHYSDVANRATGISGACLASFVAAVIGDGTALLTASPALFATWIMEGGLGLLAVGAAAGTVYFFQLSRRASLKKLAMLKIIQRYQR